ncbi:MAG TPA: MFS transporter [Streptosporangiaceae bacterium]|jgi:predicted MFS family arabinose efflux permease|nr:MFS transporter [Streptosporangiaceae bacterium]
MSAVDAAPHEDAPPGRASYRDVLGIGEFRVMFAASIVSMLGNVIASVALTVLIFERTHSAALASLVMALSFLPYLVGGVFLGTVVDRLPARRVLVGCDLASAAVVAVMVIPGVPVAGLLALVFAEGLVAPVFQGVRSALLPDILPPGPPYVLGRSLMRMVSQGAQIAGYGAGGLLLAFLPPRGALAADALSFLGSAILLRLGTARRLPQAGASRPGGVARPGGKGTMARDSLAGLRASLGHRATRRILLFGWLVPACSVAPEALAAPYATHIGQPARVAGFLLMGIPAGTVIADVLAARLLSPWWQRRIVVPAGLLSFVPLAGFAVSPGLALALALLVIAGLGSAYMAGMDGLLVATAPPGLRNRALALSSAGLMFTQGAGFALWGLVGQYVPLAVVIPAAAVTGAVAVVALRPSSGDAPLA